MNSTRLKTAALFALSHIQGRLALFALPNLLSLALIWLAVKGELEGTGHYPSAIILNFSLTLLLLFAMTGTLFTLLPILRGQRPAQASLQDPLVGFEQPNFNKILATQVWLYLYNLLWSIPYYLGTFLGFLGNRLAQQGYEPALTQIALVAGLLLSLGGTLLRLQRFLAYSQTSFILYDRLTQGTYTSGREVIRASTQLMQGQKWTYLKLCLSFAGWILACALTGGLALVLFLPYFTVTQALFYEGLRQGKTDSQTTHAN